MNVFKEMSLSIYSYESYREFLKNKKGKVFGYALLLMFLYFLIAWFLPGMTSLGLPSEMAREIRENVPDFELEDGRLWVERPFEIDADTTYIYADTGESLGDVSQIAQQLAPYQTALLMDSSQMIVKSQGSVQALSFSALDLELDREDLVELIPMLYVGALVGMVFLYVWITALFFLGVLFVALLGMIVATTMHYELTFGQLYLLAIYSRTLPLLIKAVLSFLPIHIPAFWVINFGLSLLLLALAIRKMKEQPAEGPYNAPPMEGMGQ